MKAGEVIEVLSYRDDTHTTIKYGVVENIRDIHDDTLKLKTYQKNVITRSQRLITLMGNGVYRSYYDRFLTYKPVSLHRKLWLKIRSKL